MKSNWLLKKQILMLNATELLERGIITGPIQKDNIAQHGIDLNLIKVEKIAHMGFIPAVGKTILPQYKEVKAEDGIWDLWPGAYNITFSQGCNIPADQMLLIRQRSSLLRCGGSLHSSVFDAGFKTDNIGTVMVLSQRVRIEVGARIAQIYNHECTPVTNLYDGQYQGDKQRKSA